MDTRSILLVTAGVLALASVSRADYEIHLALRNNGRLEGHKMVFKVKGTRQRLELQSNIVVLYDRSNLWHVNLDPTRKLAADMAVLDKMGPPDSVLDLPTMVAAGKKEMLHGWEAEIFSCRPGLLVETAWVVRTFPKEEAEAVRMLQRSLAKNMALGFARLPDGVVRCRVENDDLKKPGFSEWEVESISETPLNDKEFEVPADYILKTAEPTPR